MNKKISAEDKAVLEAAGVDIENSPPLKAKKAKKVAKKVKAVKKASRRAFSDSDVSKKLSGFTTVRQLSKALKVTLPAAQNYINALKKVRKVESKEVRQGKRGPLAVAFRVG